MWRNGGRAACIPDLHTRLTWVVSLTLWPLYHGIRPSCTNLIRSVWASASVWTLWRGIFVALAWDQTAIQQPPVRSFHTYLLTYTRTPCTTVLEKLTGFQLVKKFPAFYGTRRFITAVTSARHLSLFWASSIQFTPPHSTSWRSILILSSHLRLGLASALFLSGFPTKTLYTPLFSPHTCYMPHPSHCSWFYHLNNIWWAVQIIKLLLM